MPIRLAIVQPLAVRFTAVLTLSCAALVCTPGHAADSENATEDHSGHDHAQHVAGVSEHADHTNHADHEGHDDTAAADDADPHALHRAMMQQSGYQRSEHTYALSDVKLVGMDGSVTTLREELDGDKPVMLNFIFTTCTTICPVMSGIFSQVQTALGPERDDVRMISVSIDPEYDTPERLRDYAGRFHAGPEWRFLTGDPNDVIAVQRAFDVYRGNKMSHEPTTLLRRSPSDPWVRLDGIASAESIASEYRRLVAQ